MIRRLLLFAGLSLFAYAASVTSWAQISPIGTGVVAFSKAPASLTYVATATYTGSNVTNVTFTGANIGTPTSDRIVIAVLACQNSSNATGAFTGVTIGGTSAAAVVNGAGTNGVPQGIFSLLVSSGTTANIVATGSAAGGMAGCALSTYALSGYGSSTAFATGSNVATAVTSVSTSSSVQVPPAGASVVMVYNDKATITLSQGTSDASASGFYGGFNAYNFGRFNTPSNNVFGGSWAASGRGSVVAASWL